MSAAFAMTPTARATPSPSLRASSIAARRAVVAPAAARRLAPSSSSRSSRATRVVATRAEYGDVERARGQDYNASANVFVDAFFLRGKPAGDNAITPSELSYLRGAQRKDLTRRYNRRGDAAMFVIRDDDGNGDVVGCVGAEVQRFQERLYLRDPLKASQKKRFVCGLREVARALKSNKAKVLIVVHNPRS